MIRESFLFDSVSGFGVLRKLWISGDIQAHLLAPDVGQDGSDVTLDRYKPFILSTVKLHTIYQGAEVLDAENVKFKNITHGSVADALLITADGTPAIFIQRIFYLPLTVYGDLTIAFDPGPNRVALVDEPEKLTQRLLYPREKEGIAGAATTPL